MSKAIYSSRLTLCSPRNPSGVTEVPSGKAVHGQGGSPCGKLVADRVLDDDDLERALVLLPVDDGAHTAHIAPARHHDQLPHVKLDEVLDLARLDVKHHCVVHLHGWQQQQDVNTCICKRSASGQLPTTQSH